jgi:hypothetical protein
MGGMCQQVPQLKRVVCGGGGGGGGGKGFEQLWKEQPTVTCMHLLGHAGRGSSLGAASGLAVCSATARMPRHCFG